VVAALRELCRQQQQQQQQLDSAVPQPGQQQQQREQQQQQQAQEGQEVLSEHDVAALLELASHRQGMCALCKLAFAGQYQQLLQPSTQGQRAQQTEMPPPRQHHKQQQQQQQQGEVLVKGASGYAGLAVDPNAAQQAQLQHGAATDRDGQLQQQLTQTTKQQQQQQQHGIHDEPHQQQQESAEEAQQQQQVLAGLGPPVCVSMWGKCCVAVHAECGAWSTTTVQGEAGEQSDSQHQVGMHCTSAQFPLYAI
jgi:hypothetical protein